MAKRHPSNAKCWEWDEGNEEELAAHRIDSGEVEDVWNSGPVWVPNIKHRAGDWKMIGLTRGGRMLTIIVRYFDDRRSIRPITGWDTTAGERHKYSKGSR